MRKIRKVHKNMFNKPENGLRYNQASAVQRAKPEQNEKNGLFSTPPTIPEKKFPV
jgi:hypothetical protein